MLRLITALLFFATSLSLSAQPYTACFTINNQQICAGQSVIFTDCSGSFTGTLNTGDGIIQLDAAVHSNTHTYNTPGVYTIYQTVNNGVSGNSISAPQTLTVVNNTSFPTFTLNNCAGNLVTVNITDSNYDTYEIAWGDGNTGTALPLGSATHAYAATGSYTITVTGTFNSATCSSTPVPLNVTTLSALIPPVIQDLTVISQSTTGSVSLRFFANASQQYQIEEQQGGGGYSNKATVQFQSGLQVLTFFNLGTSVDPFYYRIYTYDDCGTQPQYSDDIYSVVLSGTGSNNQIELSWYDYHTFLADNFDHYELYKDGALIATSFTGNTYTDLAVSPDQTYMYQVLTYTTTGQVAYSAFIPVTNVVTAITSSRSEEVGFSPNPSADGVFKLDNSNTEFYDEISISTLEGKMIYHLSNVSDSEIIIDLSSAKPGMYIATLKNSSGVKVARLIK